MAKIIPLQASINFYQQQNENGNYYPCYLFSNDLLMDNLINSLIVAKSVIKQETPQSEVVESLLTALSDYQVWKKKQPKPELPTEIKEHFGLLPDKECNINVCLSGVKQHSKRYFIV